MIFKAPYIMAPVELKELKTQLDELKEKGYIRPSTSLGTGLGSLGQECCPPSGSPGFESNQPRKAVRLLETPPLPRGSGSLLGAGVRPF